MVDNRRRSRGIQESESLIGGNQRISVSNQIHADLLVTPADFTL